MFATRPIRQGIVSRAFINVVVLIVVGLTAFAVLFSAMQRPYQYSYWAELASGLRQMATAVHTFHGEHKELPPAIGQANGKSGTVHFHLLPFLEQEEAYKNNKLNALITAFVAPSDASGSLEKPFLDQFGTTNYAANWLAFTAGPKKGGKLVLMDSIPDGPTNTVMFAPRYQMCNGTPTLWGYDKLDEKAPFIGLLSTDVFQLNPSQKECNPKVANWWNPSFMRVALGDGSVKSIGNSISATTWALALHPADGVPMPADWDQ